MLLPAAKLELITPAVPANTPRIAVAYPNPFGVAFTRIILFLILTGTVKAKPETPKFAPVEPIVPSEPILIVLFQKKLFVAEPAVISDPLTALSATAAVA